MLAQADADGRAEDEKAKTEILQVLKDGFAGLAEMHRASAEENKRLMQLLLVFGGHGGADLQGTFGSPFR